MRYSMGLDIGIASIGWSVIDLDGQCIGDLGVRTFLAAENPKDGSSLALPRRLARGMRRRIRRRSHRIERIWSLMIHIGLLSDDEKDMLYNKPFDKDPYELRLEGLDRLLNNEEWVRVLIHIAKRRGFKSNRKSEIEKLSDTQKLLSAIENNRELFIEKGYRTIGEMFIRDEKFKNHKRNKRDDYSNTIAREMLVNEIQQLFTMQRKYDNLFADLQFENKFIEIFLSQRSYMDAEMIDKMIGFCTFEGAEKRAPKLSYTAERFILLSKINNLRLIYNGDRVGLTDDQRMTIVDLAYKYVEIKYKQIRKELGLAEEFKFAGLKYDLRNDETKNPEEAKFIELRGFHWLRKAVSSLFGGTDLWQELLTNPEKLDQIAAILTYNKTDTDIQLKMREAGFKEEIIDAVLPLNFSKVQHLSIKAMQKLIPHLMAGCRYDEACLKAGYNFNRPNNQEKQSVLPYIPIDEIRNPVVIRALTQTRKLVNAILRVYGSPEKIYIELARDLAKPFDERKRIEREQKNFQDEKEKTRGEFITTFGKEPSGLDLLKYRLWREQNGFCPYTQQYLDPSRLFEPGYSEIDHIIPYSRSFDDSMKNKVLIQAGENRNKGCRTPFEYFGMDKERWHNYEEWASANIRNWSKRQRLLKKSFNNEDMEEMKTRHLNDTRYIARFISMFIEDNLSFAENDSKKKVITVNGQITAFLRTKWGLLKVREDGDLHHAMDAAVISSVSSKMIQDIASYSKYKELYNTKVGDVYVNPETGELMDGVYQNQETKNFPMPWPNFREELIARLSPNPSEELTKLNLWNYRGNDLSKIKPIFVSRMPNRKIGGKAHEDTIKSAKYISKNIKVIKKPLSSINLNSLENMFGKERDYKLYNALKERLKQFNGDPKKAFAGDFYKPTNDGTKGPIVRSIKIIESGASGVLVNHGIAENSEMIRIDIFTKNNKFHIIPIYVADRLKKELPNLAIVAGKDESDWNMVDETYTFCFNLYPNDLVRIEVKDEIIFGYYRSCHRGTAALNIEAHDRSWHREGVGIKLAKKIEKYQVDLLGNHFLVKGEQRFELA